MDKSPPNLTPEIPRLYEEVAILASSAGPPGIVDGTMAFMATMKRPLAVFSFLHITPESSLETVARLQSVLIYAKDSRNDIRWQTGFCHQPIG